MDKRLIDADKLLEWLSSRMSGTGSDGMYFAYESVQEAIESGEFAPDPIPLPTIKPGDTKTIKFHCRECDFECVVQYDSEVFVDIDKGHCPHCGNSDAVDLEVSHD